MLFDHLILQPIRFCQFGKKSFVLDSVSLAGASIFSVCYFLIDRSDFQKRHRKLAKQSNRVKYRFTNDNVC